MWVRKSSIRPVPGYARVDSRMLDAVRGTLLTDADQAQEELDSAFADFEEQQPAIADYVGEVLSRPFSDPCLALGYFLSLAIYLAFKDGYGRAVKAVTADELRGTIELLQFDEDLREADPSEPLDTDDVIGMEQPELLRFLHEHMQATLDVQSEEIDADELRSIYRVMLIEILALSYAVQPPAGFPIEKSGMLA